MRIHITAQRRSTVCLKTGIKYRVPSEITEMKNARNVSCFKKTYKKHRAEPRWRENWSQDGGIENNWIQILPERP
jgi:hypothetical protein